MPSDKLTAAFNAQMTHEFRNEHLYLQMAAWCHEQGLGGVAHWLKMQSADEHQHAERLFDFMIERDMPVRLDQLPTPKNSWSSLTDLFSEVLEVERETTALINQLADLCLAESDHASNVFLQWFINEQVEEESIVRDIRDKLRMAGDHGPALLMIDAEMAKRAAPAPIDSNA
ncbi:MAG: ferritin [Planctomycetota bacterium]|jgi:ferritin